VGAWQVTKMPISTKYNTRAILLAAGQGKRMKSSRPKVLHEVLGRTVLARVIDAFDDVGVDHLHIVVGHGADQVKEYLVSNPPKTPFSIHLQEPQQGTGHAVMQVISELENFKGTLLVSACDTPLLKATTLKTLVNDHRGRGTTATLLSTEVDDPKNYGRILRAENGQVTGIIEDKDAADKEKRIKEVNTAIYCLEWPAVKKGILDLKNDNKQGEYYLTDIISWAHKQGLSVGAVLTPDWREVAGINSRLELSEAIRLIRDQKVNALSLISGVTVIDPLSTWIAPEVQVGQDTIILPNCYLIGDIQIGSHCSIGPNVVMQGKVTVGDRSNVLQSVVINSEIGADSRVGPFAHLREWNVLADQVRIGNFVELKKSQVGSQTNISHLSYVGDARIGSNVNIGAGTITANYDHISKLKQQTMIDDDASTGCNSTLVAPVKLGDSAMVAAGTVVTKDVPAGALAMGRARQENKEGWVNERRRRLKSLSTP
jgi:bifunctional UDP-N-acetylglucosamine pyrophosphorylase/glucosamine-1-phosphate N-acetyltransferase